jgi:hypothetical protein
MGAERPGRQERVTFVLRFHLEHGNGTPFWRGSIGEAEGEAASGRAASVCAAEAALPILGFIRRRLREASGVGLPLFRLRGRLR